MESKAKLAIIAAVVIAAIAAAAALSVPSEPADPSNVIDESPDTAGNTPDSAGLTGEILVGSILPLTGDLSTHGEENLVGTRLGISDFNDYLRDNGHPWSLRLISEDSATSPVVALEKLTALNAKGIQLVIGPETSSNIRNLKGYSDSNDMLLLSCCSTAPSLALPNDSVYRLVPDDSNQGTVLGKLAHLQGIKVLVPVYRGDTWGDGLRNSTGSSFEALGGIMSDDIRYNPESADFSSSVSLLAEDVQSHVDKHGADKVAVLYLGFGEVLQFMQSAAAHDILNDVRWFGSDANAREHKLINDKIGLEFATDVSFVAGQFAAPDNPTYVRVQDHVRETLGRDPSTYIHTSYDASWILGLSILEAGTTDASDVKAVLPGVANGYTGAIGDVMLNDAGDLVPSDYNIWAIQDGDWVLYGTYDTNTGEMNIGISVEDAVKQAVTDTIQQYTDGGSLESVTDLQHGEYYSFVVHSDLEQVLVHPRADLVGTQTDALVGADPPPETVMELLKTQDGVWVNYEFLNPDDGLVENKRSWLVLHDGYVFGSGYYMP